MDIMDMPGHMVDTMVDTDTDTLDTHTDTTERDPLSPRPRLTPLFSTPLP